MSDAIEQVARAICDQVNGEHGCGGFCHALAKYGDLARAAIEAMREPTKAMVSAMNETTIEGWDGDSFWPSKDDCTALFKVAIEAALQGR